MKRREFIKIAGVAGASLVIPWKWLGGRRVFAAPIWGGTLDPGFVPKYVMPLIKPPAMPGVFNKKKRMYDIAVRQFQQQILPTSLPVTTVWSYGSRKHPGTFNYPAFTIENDWNKQTEVTWRNELVDANRNYLPHLLPVDQTLHWANPPGGLTMRDRRGSDPTPYTGPVPMVTHVHGAHTTEESDGYAEAWYLPDAKNIPAGYATTGTFFDYFKQRYHTNWRIGRTEFVYPNDQPATTLWYHDHTLGMTRLNVYAGPAGYWLIRGGANDMDLGYVAPGVGDNPFGEYTEIPIVIQDRSFNLDGSLFYPDNRAFFEGLLPSDFDPNFPFIPDPACGGLPSDVSPIWNPEFFGNMMVVNGRTWPFLNVEQTKYRFRFLNGCNSRFLILTTDKNMTFYQIGGDQGFLPATAAQNRLLMAPAERADVIMDFSTLPVGTEVILQNLGPDEPFGGGEPGNDFDAADPTSTGIVMKFIVTAGTVLPRTGIIPTTLPAAPKLGAPAVTRDVSLNEEESATVKVLVDENEEWITPVTTACDDPNAVPFGPTSALLGTYDTVNGISTPLLWMDLISENPAVGAVEEWVIHNFTMDAHPIHVHQVHFDVIGRQTVNSDGTLGTLRPPEAWETGPKDTVIAYPGEQTRIRMLFDLPGFYVWHCHIVEHEDNEMMRPFHVGPIPPNAPAQKIPGSRVAAGNTPEQFELGQNYPNPFNPSTTIHFRLPQEETVEVKIYNTLGQEVRSLTRQKFAAGSHSVVWDGRNDHGSTVASGIYIYKFTAGKFTQTRKMNLVK